MVSLSKPIILITLLELYENDADIAQQQFDLKMTDRTNMRMAGVPESSFAHWCAF